MAFNLYDFVAKNDVNEFKLWTESLQTKQRAKLNQKLDSLQAHGDTLHPHTLTGTTSAGILKLRIRGNIQLRPMLCKGPVSVDEEYTLLMGAIEKGSKFVPKNAPNLANSKKEEVIDQPTIRRTEHERVS